MGVVSHTPGPWRIVGAPNTGDRVISAATWDTIAAFLPPSNAHCTIKGKDEPIARANAHLISAAPDLLAVLREAVREFTSGLEDGDALPAWANAAYDAIAKAEGRS